MRKKYKLKTAIFLIFTLSIQGCISKIQHELDQDISKQKSNTFLIQDSIVSPIDSILRIVYTGYIKNNNDSAYSDYIIIHHLKGNIIVLRDRLSFIRQKYEGRMLLREKSFIAQNKIDKYSFIIETSISNRGNFSENIFSYDSVQNRYRYIKRINFKEAEKNFDGYFGDTLGLKTVFLITNTYVIDSLEMNDIFQKEEQILYNDSVFSNSKWVLKQNNKID